MRSKCATGLIRAGVSLAHVQKFMGHAAITTTLKYYNWTNDDDMRAAAEKLRRYAAG